jgi:hypothetical protein
MRPHAITALPPNMHESATAAHSAAPLSSITKAVFFIKLLLPNAINKSRINIGILRNLGKPKTASAAAYIPQRTAENTVFNILRLTPASIAYEVSSNAHEIALTANISSIYITISFVLSASRLLYYDYFG